MPYLVTDWEFTDDTLVLTLRDDATFHDGSPVDAEAVKANLDRARTMETSAYLSQLRNIQSVEVADEHTVRLNLVSNTGATLPYALGGFAGMVLNPKYMDPEVLKTSAPEGVGSGPYEVASWTPGDADMVLERAGEHWDPAAGQAARVEMYTVPDPMQLVNTIAAGQYDLAMVGTRAATSALEKAASAPGTRRSPPPTSST